MKIGLIGLPRSGKTSLFNLLTGQSVATSFEGARAEMHAGLARVPDERVDRLSALFMGDERRGVDGGIEHRHQDLPLRAYA